MKNQNYVILLVIFALLMGCAGLKKGQSSIKPDRTSGKKPSWVKKSVEFKETKEKIFIYVDAQGTDREYLKSVSLDAQAHERILQIITSFSRRELDRAITGTKSSTVEKAGQTVLNYLSQARYSGLVREESYWERFKKINNYGAIEYEYEMFGEYSIPVKEVKLAIIRAWENTDSEISKNDKEAKQFMKEAKERLLNSEISDN